jgi:2-methylcitrate dehydratase PrpD
MKPGPEMDVAYVLAESAVSTLFQSLSQESLQLTVTALIDSFACALAGTNAPGVPEARKAFARWSTGTGATVWGGFGNMPGPLAAVLNAASMHALDYDDTDDEVPLHAQSVVLPVLLADIEESRPDCSGEEFLTALAVGIDMAMRVGRAGGPKASRGWNYSVISGCFGAVLALARLRKWNVETTVNALGHQLAQTAGSLQSIIDGSLAKRFQPAMMAKNVLMAGALAEAGIDGARNVFEGKAGFINLYQDGKYDKGVLLRDLGVSNLVNDLSLKPYPSCRFTHCSIDTALALREKGIRLDDIKHIHAAVSGQAVNMVGRRFDCETAGVVDAQFSIAYTATVALARGAVRIGDFTVEKIRDPDVGAFANQQFTITAHADVPFLAMAPVYFDVELKNGEKLSQARETVSGSPKRPITEKQLRDKVTDCLTHNRSSVSADQLMSVTRALPRAGSMKDVFAMLAQQ